MLNFRSLQRFFPGFRTGDWQGHSRTLICFLQSHFPGFPSSVLRVIVMLEDPATTHLQRSTEGRRFLPNILQYTALFILFLIQCSSPVTCAEKYINRRWWFHLHASLEVWCSWDDTLPSSSSKHNKWSEDQKVLFWSHLTIWHTLDHPVVLFSPSCLATAP